jgi:hypothetical protein
VFFLRCVQDSRTALLNWLCGFALGIKVEEAERYGWIPPSDSYASELLGWYFSIKLYLGVKRAD